MAMSEQFGMRGRRLGATAGCAAWDRVMAPGSGGHQEHPPPRIPRGRWHHLLPAAVEHFYPNNKVWGRDAVDLTKS